MLNFIRPVGEPLSLIQSAAKLGEYEGYTSTYVESGTQALQLALHIAKAKAQAKSGNKHCEVILPAYGCPDLVSACVGAGVKPVLADLGANSAFPSIASLEAVISEHTAAVVLVNFLGISPPAELFSFIKEKGLVCIEDRAQGFVSCHQAQQLQGDLVVFSFGKGKAVSILGGGALLCADSLEHDAAMQLDEGSPLNSSFKAKALAYNLVIQPWLYAWLLKVPGLNIGQTAYHAPERPTRLHQDKTSLINSNIERQHSQNIAAEMALDDIVQQKGHQAVAQPLAGQRLLRFPVLIADKTLRERCLALLETNGIGATTMYQKPLNEMTDTPLDQDVRAANYPNAKAFAERLLTLPCHSGVDEGVIEHIERVLMHSSSPINPVKSDTQAQ